MEDLLGSASTVVGGLTPSSILAIFQIAAGGITVETLFQSLIDGLKNFMQFIFTSLDALN